MKVAFTTHDSETINAHFGWAQCIDVYDVDTNGYAFRETLEFGGDLKEDGNEDKLEPKVKALAGCTLVYVSAIGGSAAARLMRHQITPVKSQTEADDIQDVLTRLVEILNSSPPPWLRKALQTNQPRNFDDDFDTIEEEILV